MQFSFEVLDKIDDADLAAIEALYAQLDHQPLQPIKALVEAIIESPSSRLLVVRGQDGGLIGMSVLNLVYKVANIEARIDDVVVDESTRGHGIGQALMERAIALCWETDASRIELTSRADRKAAHHIYQKLGFEKRETNVYQLKKEQ